VLDCKESQCRSVIDEAPQIIDWLSDESKQFFMKVLEFLDDMEVPYILRATLVRGLDYYSDTVFELYTAEEGETTAQSALGGGGRYDGLVELLGGRPTPASGFALGLERIASVIRRAHEAAGSAPEIDLPKVYLAQLGEQARRRALYLIEKLRRSGIPTQHNIGKSSLKGQLELANKTGVKNVFIIGQKEVQDGTIIVRNMESGNQEIIDQNKIVQEIERLNKSV